LSAEAAREPPASVCPGLFRVVAARDGGLCRVRLPLGRLSADQSRAVGRAALRFGSGVVETTNRANLQIRGVQDDREPRLVEALLAAGFGPAQPRADDVRNVMVSPTAGIDALQHLDVQPLALGLLCHLENDSGSRSLSPKFSFLVDGGESVAAIDRPHDVWLAGMGGGDVALGLAGSPPTRADDAAPFIAIRVDRAIDAAVAAVRLFLDAAADDPAIMRFRDLLSRVPGPRMLDELSERLGARGRRGQAVASWRRQSSLVTGPIGIGEQRQEGMAFVGAAPPLARLTPAMLERVADLAEAEGDGTLRLTPWHGLILPYVARNLAGTVVRGLSAAGFVTDPRDPLASIVACSGSTGCRRGLSDTKSDGSALAAMLGTSCGTIHLSGCAKGCASATVADVTMIAVQPGSYDVFSKESPVARGLGIADVGARLRGRAA
jgi:precorrin-3B synthase